MHKLSSHPVDEHQHRPFPTLHAHRCLQAYMQLKEDEVQGLLSEWGVSVEDFVALCETMLKRCDDPRAERILDNLLE